MRVRGERRAGRDVRDRGRPAPVSPRREPRWGNRALARAERLRARRIAWYVRSAPPAPNGQAPPHGDPRGPAAPGPGAAPGPLAPHERAWLAVLEVLREAGGPLPRAAVAEAAAARLTTRGTDGIGPAVGHAIDDLRHIGAVVRTADGRLAPGAAAAGLHDAEDVRRRLRAWVAGRGTGGPGA